MASGDSLAELDVLGSFPPSSNYATFEATTLTPMLAFDDSTDESIYFRFFMPSHYDGSSSIKVVIPWKFKTYVGSQTCAWKVAFYRIGDDTDSVETFTFAADQSVTDTEASATGEVSYAEITFTNAQADGIQPGEWCFLRLKRDAASGTASPGDAHVGVVYLKVA